MSVGGSVYSGELQQAPLSSYLQEKAHCDSCSDTEDVRGCPRGAVQPRPAAPCRSPLGLHSQDLFC